MTSLHRMRRDANFVFIFSLRSLPHSYGRMSDYATYAFTAVTPMLDMFLVGRSSSIAALSNTYGPELRDSYDAMRLPT